MTVKKINESICHEEGPKGLPLNKRKLFGSRIKFCFAFVASKKGYCNGYRHKLLLIFATAAIPLYGLAQGKAKMEFLSQQFLDGEPISKKYISDTAEKAEKYKFKNQTICDWLNISLSEYTHLIKANSESEKRKNKKVATAKKREERNAIIIEAINSGKSHREVAKLVGCSTRTVDYVVAQTNRDRMIK